MLELCPPAHIPTDAAAFISCGICVEEVGLIDCFDTLTDKYSFICKRCAAGLIEEQAAYRAERPVRNGSAPFTRRDYSGQNNPAAKLNEAQVREIKQALREGVRNGVLARKYGVTSNVITNIRLGRTWQHVD